jgi:hypothetical protein
MQHVAACRGQGKGMSDADIAACVRKKSKADPLMQRTRSTSARKAKLLKQKFAKKASARRALRKKVMQVAKQSFEQQHPNAKARLRRQRARKNKPKKTAKLAKQMAKKQLAAKPHPLKYHPFIDQPEYGPRFDPDGIHREVDSSAQKFVKKTYFGPKDGSDKIQAAPRKSDAVSELEVEATRKKMVASIKAEEKKEKDQETLLKDTVSQKMKRAAKKLRAKKNQPKTDFRSKKPKKKKESVLTHSDKRLIRSEAAAVMRHVNHVAKYTSEQVMEYDKKGPAPAGSTQQVSVTAQKIAGQVLKKISTAKKAAATLMKKAKIKAKKYVARAQKAKKKAQDLKKRSPGLGTG